MQKHDTPRIINNEIVLLTTMFPPTMKAGGGGVLEVGRIYFSLAIMSILMAYFIMLPVRWLMVGGFGIVSLATGLSFGRKIKQMHMILSSLLAFLMFMQNVGQHPQLKLPKTYN